MFCVLYDHKSWVVVVVVLVVCLQEVCDIYIVINSITLCTFVGFIFIVTEIYSYL